MHRFLIFDLEHISQTPLHSNCGAKFCVVRVLSCCSIFGKVFPDPKIASQYMCKRTKTAAIVTNALKPHYRAPMVEIAQTSSFNLLCDESNERGAEEKIFTILPRLFDPKEGKVDTRHLETVGVTDLRANRDFRCSPTHHTRTLMACRSTAWLVLPLIHATS